MQVACTRCSCIDAIPADYAATTRDDPCGCGHALGDHRAPCPSCGEEVEGYDVACRRCGALLGDEIERATFESRSGLAIAAFAIALLVPVASPVALVLGIVALRQVRRRAELRGEGLAIAAIVLAGFWIAAITIGLVLGA